MTLMALPKFKNLIAPQAKNRKKEICLMDKKVLTMPLKEEDMGKTELYQYVLIYVRD